MLIKTITALLAPLSLVLLLVVIGVLLVAWRRRLGYASIACGLMLALLLSLEPVARALLLPLESRHQPLTELDGLEHMRWVVVLGAGASNAAEYPVTTRLSGVAALRLLEGLRLHRELPASQLVLSGGTVFRGEPSATVLSRAALALGAEPQRLTISPAPGNTREEVRLLREVVGNEPFVLVTSASHMPRAVALSRRAGLNPVPAPTAWRTKLIRDGDDPARFLPSANALAMSERAFHEYMGLLWARFQGDI